MARIARHETEVVALKLRAAARDAACPLIEVLCVEVRGIQAAILKDLRAARDMVVGRKAEVEMEQRWENRFMPFIRPALIALPFGRRQPCLPNARPPNSVPRAVGRRARRRNRKSHVR